LKKKIKKIAKTLTIILLSSVILGCITYYLGPKPARPKLETLNISLTSDLHLLEKQINGSELSTHGLKQGCEAKIIWADTTKKVKTRFAFLYIHGGASSRMDGDPVHRNIAKRYNANLYLARLAGHGVDLGDSTLAKETADDFAYSAEYALAVAKNLGDEVVVIGTSFGGAITVYLASRHPEIKAIVLYSPCIKTYDTRTGIFIKPWGLKLVQLMTGSKTFNAKLPDAESAKYWTTHYDLNFIAQFQNFLTYADTKETFEKIKCPTFMGYWYKDEQVKDTVASVPAMLQMFEELGTVNKQKSAFPNVGNHGIASAILSKDVESVQHETERFLDGILK
jgi:esterase/lipase